MKDTADPPKSNCPSIRLDIKDWMSYLEDKNVPEAEKITLVETVWDIAKAFVDLGWELDTAEENSGQSYDLTAALCAAVLHSNSNVTDEENV